MEVNNKTHLVQAAYKDKPLMWGLLQNYLDELSAYGSFDKAYPHFNLYWTDGDRWPYFIQLGNEVIGLCFINKNSPFGYQTDFFLAEFYIKPACRKSGHGTKAVQAILEVYKGQWELAFFVKNAAALKFWPVVLSKSGIKDIKVIDRANVTVLKFSNKVIC